VIPAQAPPRVVGVKRLADYLKRKLEKDVQLRSLSVRGEVTNASVARSGHMNFDLKEGDTILRCFAWESDCVRFPPFQNGSAIVATGAISTYAQKSSYQLIVRAVERDGVGDVHALFEDRKKRLAAEGLFEPSRKRALPRFPFRVALVSSRTANGAIDFVTLLRERAPHVRVVWCETTVQGPNAPSAIVAALGRASREDVDLIVVTRGGGSFEDLFAFSDEAVVRAVARARHPVIAAIGHTVDQQLCDFAADVHVETPSAAAKAVGFSTRELRDRVSDQLRRAQKATMLRSERMRARLDAALVRSKLSDARTLLAPLAHRLDTLDDALADAANGRVRERDAALRAVVRRLDRQDPSRRLIEREAALRAVGRRLDAAHERRVEGARRASHDVAAKLDSAMRASLERAGRRLALASAHLDGKNPEAILQRGYAIVTYGGTILRDPDAVPAGAVVEARIARGTISARVESVRRNESDGNQRSG
jgi:exodeoxyribonuclease VII large subunit